MNRDEDWQPFDRVKEISYRLVSWPSETGIQWTQEVA